MWDQDWALLGIEPTTALGAIKKAYARKLRVTRPDDDAQAYQALRSAYERTQQWAKSQEFPAPDPVDPEPESAVAPVSVSRTTAAQDAAPPEPESPHDVVQSLHALWQQQGSPSLKAAWPAVHALLEAQPLASHAEWSAHFAHWVIQHDNLPDDFVFALNHYFDWQGDFRVERQIGAQLAAAVQQTLHTRLTRPAMPSEELRERVKPLRQLDKLRGQRGRGLWIATLLRPVLMRMLSGMDPRTLGQCGIDPMMRRSLDKQLQAAWLLRAGLLGGLVFALFLLASDDRDLATLRMTMWCLWGAGWLAVSHIFGLFMHHGVALQRPDRPALTLPLQRWRRHPRQPAIGLGVVAAAALLAAFGQGWDLTAMAMPVPDHIAALLQMLLDAAPWLVLWMGALLAWPLHPVFSAACLGLLVPVGALLFRWASPADPWAAVIAIAVLYVLVGAARFENRLGGNFLLDAVCRPVTNTLALADRWGWSFALLPSLLTLAYLFSAKPHPPVPNLVLAWILSTLALHQLQQRAEAWALARLNRA